MQATLSARLDFCRILVFAESVAVGTLLCAAQAPLSAQPDKAEAATTRAQKTDNAAAAAGAKSSAHHFDQVVIIVLENGDYEVAVCLLYTSRCV